MLNRRNFMKLGAGVVGLFVKPAIVSSASEPAESPAITWLSTPDEIYTNFPTLRKAIGGAVKPKEFMLIAQEKVAGPRIAQMLASSWLKNCRSLLTHHIGNAADWREKYHGINWREKYHEIKKLESRTREEDRCALVLNYWSTGPILLHYLVSYTLQIENLTLPSITSEKLIAARCRLTKNRYGLHCSFDIIGDGSKFHEIIGTGVIHA